MQAIALLSRREHSRQELRAKLLAALRKRERDEAAFNAAVASHAAAVGRALQATPSNGIDDAFAPRGAAEAVPAEDIFTNARARLDADVDADAGAGAGAGADVDADTGAGTDTAAPPRDAASEVDTLLDWLVAHRYLSDERFVESRVHARVAKQGTARIRQELARHGLALAPEQAASLRESEFQRAQALWQRKFGTVAVAPRDRARQARFLLSRGFAADVVRRIVGGDDAY